MFIQEISGTNIVGSMSYIPITEFPEQAPWLSEKER
jgi:hypothetical protein